MDKQFATIITAKPAAAPIEQVSNRMDRSFRIFSEGATTNDKVYKESTVLANVNNNLSYLRPKQKHFYERVPQERVDEFNQIRSADVDRSQKMVNNRFPELSEARETFLGRDNKLPSKQVQASEVVKFSEVVEKLAQEEEPFPGRSQFGETQSQIKKNSDRASGFEDRSKSMHVSTVRGNLGNAGKSTMSASIKTKYIVRSRHNELTTNRFIPVNSVEAKGMVKKEIIHDKGQPKRNDYEAMQRSTMMMKSIHGVSVFKNTSPVTQDQLQVDSIPLTLQPLVFYELSRARPSATLDGENEFKKFCPSQKEKQNARVAVLDNFKEISRIMTQNYLTHKKLEKRYQGSAIPKSELQKMRQEEEAQQRMTSIMKQMHSPSNFAAPEVTLPGAQPSAYRSMMGNKTSTISTMRQANMNNSPRTSTKSKHPKNKFIGESP